LSGEKARTLPVPKDQEGVATLTFRLGRNYETKRGGVLKKRSRKRRRVQELKGKRRTAAPPMTLENWKRNG